MHNQTAICALRLHASSLLLLCSPVTCADCKLSGALCLDICTLFLLCSPVTSADRKHKLSGTPYLRARPSSALRRAAG
eukprot:1160837-Pelagomonas_calceolata.AAC.6